LASRKRNDECHSAGHSAATITKATRPALGEKWLASEYTATIAPTSR
jgi:hypothetical protein